MNSNSPSSEPPDPFEGLFNSDFKQHQPIGPAPPTAQPETCAIYSSDSSPAKHVDTIVVGAGAAGLYAGWKVAEANIAISKGEGGEQVRGELLVLEAEDRVGGRVYDVDLSGGEPREPVDDDDDQSPDNEPVGLGAWRFRAGDQLVVSLAQRFGLKLREWVIDEVLLEARSVCAKSAKELRAKAFPEIEKLYRENGATTFDLQKDLIQRVAANPSQLQSQHGHIASFAHSIYGPEAVDYLKALYGAWTTHMYNADLVFMISRWIKTPWGSHVEYRPFGGLSAVIRGLVRECVGCGVEVRKGEGVVEIEKVLDEQEGAGEGQTGDGTTVRRRYLVRTTKDTIYTCSNLILTLTPTQLQRIRSRFLEKYLFSQPIFKALSPALAFKAAMSFKEAWWEPELAFPGNKKDGEDGVGEGEPVVGIGHAGQSAKPGTAATTNGEHDHHTSSEDELTIIPDEKPGPYPALSTKSTSLGLVVPYRSPPSGPFTLHAAYTDDPLSCATAIPLNDSPELMQTFVLSQLRSVFPHKEIPEPLAFTYMIWKDGAYHYQKPGTRFSNLAYNEWSSEPIRGERLGLAGESWGAKRAWVEGALQSAERCVGRMFGRGRGVFDVDDGDS